MVIACDGIWNVKGSQEVVDFVADRLREQRENDMFNLENICEELLDSCLAPDTSGDGSGCDNMTSIIVVFNAESDTADHNNKKRKLQQDAETPDGDVADKKIKTDQNS
ncbi:Protein phosphatase 1G [Desmophyllum pertusum]|uniref:Protein phosphatase 1G n=1 Tax=Desmophyllum pertusum TaxID=174260 RepID=A0A9X0CUE3_9CNID|nr:Protein phosphatase 1G [Desmophyllum pertusum]